MRFQLLIAEPNDELRRELADYFACQGFAVRAVGTTSELVQELERMPPGALLLEPELLCGDVTSGALHVPTIVLTRHIGELPPLPQRLVLKRRFNKPACLTDVTASLLAASG